MYHMLRMIKIPIDGLASELSLPEYICENFLGSYLVFGPCEASGLPDDKALRLPSTYGMPKQISILYSNHS